MKKLTGILILGAALLALYLTWIRPWHLRWGATDEEVAMSLPGDGIAQDPDFNATRAITVNASPEDIWPWIVQMGFNRGGFYSYDCIDNLCRPSADTLLPEFQDLAVGNAVPISKWVSMTVKGFELNKWILWEGAEQDGSWLWFLDPIDETHTRLIVRMRFAYHWTSPFIAAELATDVGDIIMLRKCMLGIKDRAETLALQG